MAGEPLPPELATVELELRERQRGEPSGDLRPRVLGAVRRELRRRFWRRAILAAAAVNSPAFAASDAPAPEISSVMARLSTFMAEAAVKPVPAEVAEKAKQHILDTLGALNRDGLGILLVEQKAPLALRLAQRVYVLSSGSVRAELPAHEIKSHHDLARFYFH